MGDVEAEYPASQDPRTQEEWSELGPQDAGATVQFPRPTAAGRGFAEWEEPTYPPTNQVALDHQQVPTWVLTEPSRPSPYPRQQAPRSEPTPVRPVEQPRPVSVGAFTPYSIGAPGRAADQVIPLPDQENWHRRDSVFDGFTLVGHDSTRRVVLRAASVRGLSHRAYGKPRQDEYGYQLTPDGRYLVLCVADGLSSGSRSHLAAEVAVRTGVALLVKTLAQTVPAELDWDQIVGEVAGHIVAYARKRLPDGEGMTVEQVVDWMGTTATYAVVDLAGDVLDVHAVMVGDSSAWVLHADGWQPLSEVKNAGADVATSAVEALPRIGQHNRPRLHAAVSPGEALVLMSDGVGDALGEGHGEVGAFLCAAWRTPPHEVEFVGQVGFTRKSFDDDRTVIAVWPAPRP